jgi:uncharacterized protein (DUF1778 family)
MAVRARFDMRLSSAHKELLEQAAAASGQDLTSFALEACLERAESVLHRHQVTTLTRRDMKAFLKLLDNPPAPNAALKAAFRRLKDFRERR